MSSDRISFAEYVDGVAKMSRVLRRAFETHCAGDSQKFNYRTVQEWDRTRSEFLSQGRQQHG